MTVQRGLTGPDYLAAMVDLLRRVRVADSVAGVWEAADFEWWWRRPRPTDHREQLFWFAGESPVAAATTTDWGDRIGLDIVVMPGTAADLVAEVFQAGLASATSASPRCVEVMVDDSDIALVSLLVESGFERSGESGSSAWMPATGRPPVTSLAEGYRLATRAELRSQPHHFTARNGPEVERRLRQTSMYRPDLDLAVVDHVGEVVGYGLFWHDPVTGVGFVEPMGVDEQHRRVGIARHVLTAGLDRLAAAGSTRLKVNFEDDNQASAALYPSAGFETLMKTSIFTRS